MSLTESLPVHRSLFLCVTLKQPIDPDLVHGKGSIRKHWITESHHFIKLTFLINLVLIKRQSFSECGPFDFSTSTSLSVEVVLSHPGTQTDCSRFRCNVQPRLRSEWNLKVPCTRLYKRKKRGWKPKPKECESWFSQDRLFVPHYLSVIGSSSVCRTQPQDQTHRNPFSQLEELVIGCRNLLYYLLFWKGRVERPK